MDAHLKAVVLRNIEEGKYQTKKRRKKKAGSGDGEGNSSSESDSDCDSDGNCDGDSGGGSGGGASSGREGSGLVACNPALLHDRRVQYQFSDLQWYSGVVTAISDGTQANYSGVLLPAGRYHIRYDDGEEDWYWLRVTYQHLDAPGGWRAE